MTKLKRELMIKLKRLPGGGLIIPPELFDPPLPPSPLLPDPLPLASALPFPAPLPPEELASSPSPALPPLEVEEDGDDGDDGEEGLEEDPPTPSPALPAPESGRCGPSSTLPATSPVGVAWHGQSSSDRRSSISSSSSHDYTGWIGKRIVSQARGGRHR